jgi:signal transduction histidine kinase
MRVPSPVPRTIRGRVTAVAVVIVAVALGLAGYVTVRLQEQVLTDRVEDTLSARGADIAAGVTSGTLSVVLDSTGQEGGLAQVVDASGTVVAATPNAAGARPVVADRPPPGRQVVTRVGRLPIDDEPFLVLARTVAGPSGPRTVLVAESLDAVESARAALVPIIAVGLPVILLLVGSVTALALRRALQPVERARREVEAIGSDRLDRRLTPLGTGDEIDRLTMTMNDLLDRLAAAYRREQQFVGDASHELRSPLASIRAQLEADLVDPARADPLRTETGVLEEVSRLEGLVDALLALARDQGAPSPPPTLLDLDDIVLDELRRLRPGAIALGTAGVSAGQVRGDRGDLERAVRNLLDNAVRHARSRVDVTLAEHRGRVLLTVANDGDPVPPAERERIFARFARTDAARARDVGGAGLGLAIARAIVVRHGGTIAVDPDRRDGAGFVVDLPAAVDVGPAPSRGPEVAGPEPLGQG